MSTNEGTLFDRIPKNKLAELANGFSADTTAQQAVQALAALGIEATEEEAQALLGSLFVKKGSLKPLGDDAADAIAGGGFYGPDGSYYADGSYIPTYEVSYCGY